MQWKAIKNVPRPLRHHVKWRYWENRFQVRFSTFSESSEAKDSPISGVPSSHSPLPRPPSVSTSTTVSESNNRPTAFLRRPPAALNHPHYHQPPHLLSLHHHSAAAAAAAAVAARARHLQQQIEGKDASNKVDADSGEEEEEEINVQVGLGALSIFLAY